MIGQVLSFDTSAGLEQGKIKCCVKLGCGHVVTVPKSVLAFMNDDDQCVSCIKSGKTTNKKDD